MKKAPTVATLGSISSAAAGIIADPYFVNQLSKGIAYSIVTHYGWKMAALMKGNPGMPFVAAIDAGYIKNTGMLFAISAAMRSSTTPRKLKFVVLDSNKCPEKHFKKHGNCFKKTATNLFWKSQDRIVGGKPQGVLKQKIFGDAMPKFQDVGFGRMQSLYFKGKTVANLDWHIKEGWEIEFISLSINAPLSTINIKHEGSKAYQNIATQTEQAYSVLAKKYPHMFNS